jgi:hypothetical protein
VLGFDCANKSLAWTLVEVDASRLSTMCTDSLGTADTSKQVVMNAIPIDIMTLPSDRTSLSSIQNILTSASRSLSQVIRIVACDAVDLLCSRKVDDVSEAERAQLLRQYLDGNPFISAASLRQHAPICILIEHQPPKIGKFAKTNYKSSAVSYQLMFYYSEFDARFISPKIKNNICLADGLDFDTFLRAEMVGHKSKDNKYNARKKHTWANMVYFMESMDNPSVSLKSPFRYDIADSFAQILMYLRQEWTGK